MRVELRKTLRLKGEVTPPPDKSISHRAIMFSSLSEGRSVIKNFLRASDTLSTLNAFRALGVEISEGKDIIVEGKGIYGLKEPMQVIDCGNSGTTIRLISGVLSGNDFFSVLTGDESLRSRPMGRVITPLSRMGAKIMARGNRKYAPLAIKGGGLSPIDYEMPVSSAQVKSAILLAGLFTEGITAVSEPVKSRDHTERMLPAYGADLKVEGLTVKIKGGAQMKALDFEVPGDFSSAAFFMASAVLVEGSEILIRRVGMNPTRTGFLKVLEDMGASIDILETGEVSGEPVADIRCRHCRLKATEVGPDILPSLIDEFPILCILASQAEGVTTIRGAGELRVKESDRIKTMAEGLKKMGVELEEFEDGVSIRGRTGLSGATIDSHGDHRVAMSFAVGSLVASGITSIEGAESVDVSFPGFFEVLSELGG